MNLKIKLLVILLIFPLVYSTHTYAQATVKIMSYNVLNYTPSVLGTRKTALYNVINPVDPDILIGIEIQDQAAANDFLANVLNSVTSGKYSVGISPDALANGGYDNYIFYRTGMFNTPTATIVNDNNTSKWPTYKFVIEHSNGISLIIYGAHLTSGTTNSAQRLIEATAIRNSTAQLVNGEYFIAMGDFNLVESETESAYSALLNTTTPDATNYFIDAGSGSFDKSLYTFDIMGTFKFRFDFVFNSVSVTSGGAVDYITNSFEVLGNTNGTTGAPYTTASDHLPVYAEYTFDPALPVELAAFTGNFVNNEIALNWRTETEVNNYGFFIERKTPLSSQTEGNDGAWTNIGFEEGYGNSNAPKQYSFTDSDINQSGKYYYRLKQVDNDGTFEYSGVVTVEVGSPNNFYLSQNFPNPFNPSTRIDFSLSEKQTVTLKVYNSLGELVSELVNEEREPGSYSVTFDASNLSSGVYVYRLQTSGFTANKKMILLK